MFLSILYAAVVLIDVTYAGSYMCPSPPQMLPCKCRNIYLGLDVACENARLDQIRGPLAEIGRTSRRVHNLTLEHIQLPNLPSNLLLGTDIFLISVKKCYTSTVDEDAFAGFATKLERLFITNNPLAQVPSKALQKLSNLQYLILDDNAIQILQAEAFKGLHSLLELSLYGNGIKFIDDSAFVGIGSRFENLSLGGNGLTAVPSEPLSKLSSLQHLHLQDNRIDSLIPEDFEVMGCESLSDLNLANNTIRHLPARVFGSLKKLFILNVCRNVIDSIHPLAFEGNEDTLRMLIICYNQLEEIPTSSLKNLSRLYYIDLRGNDICEVRKEDFLPYGKNLGHILLQNNSLKYVDPEAFIDLNILKSLFLQSNQLNAASFETYSHLLDTLERFDIHGKKNNPLLCDCNLSWLANWINGNGSRIVVVANETSCVTPNEQTKKLLSEVTLDQMVCGNSESDLSEPSCNFVPNAYKRLSSDGFTTVLQLGFILLLTVLGTARLF